MIAHYDDLTDLWHDTVWTMWRGTLDNGGVDFVASIDTILYDNLLQADSMAYEFDLGRDLWLTKHRWSVLVRQYLDDSETRRFLDRAADIGLGEGKRGVCTSMFARNVAREAKKHRWGNCMAAFTYRGLRNGQPHFSLHSRVSYIAYIGGLDLALACVLAREIGRRIQVPLEDFSFAWYVDALQFHGFKSLPLLFRTDYIEDLDRPALRRKYPTQKIVGKWWDKIVNDTANGKPLEEEKYGPLKRVRRRYGEYINDQPLPSITLKDLTLDPLWRR
jgi:hypothetical protein